MSFLHLGLSHIFLVSQHKKGIFFCVKLKAHVPDVALDDTLSGPQDHILNVKYYFLLNFFVTFDFDVERATEIFKLEEIATKERC